jgi:23S rRNA pseudouridine2605 synthase
MDKGVPVRLQRYLAACGVASRRRSEEYILNGRVKVNGETVRALGTKVTAADTILFDEKPVRPETRMVYVALNKPRGYICSSSDPENRPMAIDLIKDKYPERIFSVGRLDFNTSGLLLFTNDGEYARIVSHPSSEIEKEYRVETVEPIDGEVLKGFKNGVTIDGTRYMISDYTITGTRQVRIVLIEGKNRELRQLFASAGNPVRRIHRVRIGPIRIGNLSSGKHRNLNGKEISWFFNKAGKKK